MRSAPPPSPRERRARADWLGSTLDETEVSETIGVPAALGFLEDQHSPSVRKHTPTGPALSYLAALGEWMDDVGDRR
jgi:hypothetical protein